MKKIIFTLLLISAAFAVNVDMRLDVEDRVYHIGDRINLKYRLTAGQKYFFILPELKEYLSGVEIIEVEKNSKLKRGNQIIELQAEIVSFDTGFVHIPFMPVISTDSTGFGKPDTFYTPEKYIYIYSILDSSAAPVAMNAPLPLALMTWWEMLVAIVLLAAAVSILVIGLKHRKKKSEQLEIVWESPEEKAEHLLKKLEEKQYPQHDEWKAFYLELTYIARDYFENIYYIHLQELTTTDLIPVLKEHLDKTLLKEMSELFTYADLVKFAKGNASDENCNRHLELIKEVINDRKMNDKAELD